MKRTLLLLSLLVPVVIVAALLATLAWLFETEAGLHWAYAQLQARVPGTLEIKSLDGKLAGPIRIGDLVYRSDDVDIRVEHAQLAWAPAALLVGRLQVDALTIRGVHVRLPDGDRSQRPNPPAFALPLNLSLADVRIERLRVDTRGGASYLVDSAELTGFIGQQIARIDRMKIAAPNFAVDADGALGLRGDTDRTLRVQWRVAPSAQLAIKGSGTIGGNLSRLTFAQQIAEPIVASVSGEIRQPVADPQWQFSASVSEFDAQRLGPVGRALRLGGTLDASGGLVRYQARGQVRAQTPDFPPLAAEFALNGTTAVDEVVLDRLALHVPDTDIELTAQARWQPRDRTWTAAAQWQNLRWPVTNDVLVASPQGRLDASGTHADYRAQLDFATTANNLPPAHWRATVSGDWNSAAFSDVSIDTLGSTARGTARAAWSPRLQWSAELEAPALDPAVAWPEWPGSLAIQAMLSGDRDELRANVAALSGRLRGQAFAAKASAVRRGDDFPQFALDITSGEAKAKISGTLDREWNLVWQLNAPDLEKLLPNAAGSVIGNGRVTGARALPRIEAKLSAARLAYAGTLVRAAAIETAIDLSDRTRSRVVLSATQVTLFKRVFERIAATVDGFRSDHTVSVDANWAQAVLTAELRGAYRDNAWSGAFTQSAVRLGSERWALVGQPKLLVDTNRIRLDQTCWGAANTRACVELSGTVGTPTTLSLLTQELPLILLAPLLPNAPDWHGTVSGKAQVQFDGRRVARADAQLDFSAGEMTVLDTSNTVFAYDRAASQVIIDDQGLRASAAITLPSGDGGTAELALPQFHSDIEFKRQPVTGRLAFTLLNLAPVAALLPQLEELSGALQAQFTVAGTLADPRVRGEAALTHGAARIPATGIRIHDVRLVASADGGEALRLSGEAQSGPGRLTLSGRVIFPDDRAWRAELGIVGEQFHVADMRDTQIYVSPDLRAKLAPDEIDVSGSVRLPKASFALRSQKSNVVETSPDLVIVNAPAGAPKPEPRWKVSAQIRVLLGEEVTFSGFGLNAKIAGDVALTEVPGQPTTARGEVRVIKGQYDAYGQKLDVERGRLIFVGGPVANPGIDARAVRKIEQVTAGVEIKGTLQAPQLTLFSNPAMSQSDALSYLVFGRPLEGASAEEGRSLAAAARALKLAGGERLAQRIGAVFGVEQVAIETGTTSEAAALVLGKQLSPRLYINYSIGLFTPENVLQLKYKLSQRWSLEAQSGTRAGGDLIFTIEK